MKYHSPFEVDEDEDKMPNILQERFWSYLRASLFKKICKGKGGANQWAYITGKKTRDSKGQRICLTERNLALLERICRYLNSEEGQSDLLKDGIDQAKAPCHPDELVEIIANSKCIREIRKQEFRMFLKNRDDILHHLERFSL